MAAVPHRRFHRVHRHQLGQKDLDEMKDQGGCAPRCDESRIDAARTKIVAANVSLGVGLVAAGLGTYFL